MAEKVLKLYKYVDGVNDAPFPNAEQQVEIYEFTYEAQRNSTTPQITATVMHPLCLDNLWTSEVYAEFNGEKYYVINTPSSSKDNSDQRYKHDVILLSEREKLNHVYFIDAVQDDTSVDKYKSNSLKVVFFGDIEELASRLNDALSYANLDYTVVVDEGITTEAKLMEFESKYISEVLSESYSSYEVPYYFVGKIIHFGYTDNAIPTVFKYGFSDALLSITKQNANYAIINRITGVGSSDNIPYYYPNDTNKGNVSVTYTDISPQSGIVTNLDTLVKTLPENSSLYYKAGLKTTISDYNESRSWIYLLRSGQYSLGQGGFNPSTQFNGNGRDDINARLSIRMDSPSVGRIKYYKIAIILTVSQPRGNSYEISEILKEITYRTNTGTNPNVGDLKIISEYSGSLSTPYGTNQRIARISFRTENQDTAAPFNFYLEFPNARPTTQFSFNVESYGTSDVWIDSSVGREVELEDYGIKLSDDIQLGTAPQISYTITSKITPSSTLMPPIYRETLGAQRFYNAVNNTYQDDEGNYYTFENLYSPLNVREGYTTFDDIKPTIKNMTNAAGQRIDTILDVAFDTNDDDSYTEDEDNLVYNHPYFYVKLRKFDGEYGFNLFDHAIEQQTMQISMTSGACGTCTFEIGVGKETQLNTVQVDDNGNLLRDSNGNVIRNGSPQDRQNDTINNEVWIALKKEESTYGQLMPNSLQNLKPKADDTFVILGIKLPNAYILNAENELEEALIKYMAENNMEKYDFSILFSHIYLEQNPTIANQLNENSRILIEYNGKQIPLYVNGYTYKMDASSSLPEITVELTDTVSVEKNSLQQTVENVISDALSYSGAGGADFLKQALPYFLRKDVPDSTTNLMKFLGGIITNNLKSSNYMSGALGYGFGLEHINGKSHMEVDELLVRTRAIFQELSILETSLLGASFMFNPTGAWIKVTRVENLTINGVGVYRCYFAQDDGEKSIQNRFIVGNQARSQSFNIEAGVYENVSNHYYWRLVTNVGQDFIDLSVDDCDTNSTAPAVGDIIVQVGDRNDIDYQSVIVLSAFGDNAPYITFYTGINSYSFENKDIVTIGYDKAKQECFFKSYGRFYAGNREETDYVKYTKEDGLEVAGKMTIKPGSSGAQNISDLPDYIQDAVTLGSENLLRNTSFAGDYDSINLAPSTELEPATDMYSPKLVHWTGTANVRDDEQSITGYSCNIGGISQIVNTIKDEQYIVSLRAKGSEFTISCGGFTTTQTLTSEYVLYSYKFKANATTTIFMITGDATFCELKMERGTIRTDWTPSYLDTDPIADKFKTLWPITDALRGNTQTIGGLTLASMIMLGQWIDGKMSKVTGGISGVSNTGNEVAFWAGGDYQSAYNSIKKLRNKEQISDEEWASLAKFVVLHSGDVFMRGYIYAEGGYFRGDIYAENGYFNGVVSSKYNMPKYSTFGMNTTTFTIDPDRDGTRFFGIGWKYDTEEDALKHILRLPKVGRKQTMEVQVFCPGMSDEVQSAYQNRFTGITIGLNTEQECHMYSNMQEYFNYLRIIPPGYVTLIGHGDVVTDMAQWYAFGLNFEFSDNAASWPSDDDTEGDNDPSGDRGGRSHTYGYNNSTRR